MYGPKWGKNASGWASWRENMTWLIYIPVSAVCKRRGCCVIWLSHVGDVTWAYDWRKSLTYLYALFIKGEGALLPHSTVYLHTHFWRVVGTRCQQLRLQCCTWMSHVSYMIESRHTQGRITPHTWISCSTALSAVVSELLHINESCQAYEWVISHSWTQHTR